MVIQARALCLATTSKVCSQNTSNNFSRCSTLKDLFNKSVSRDPSQLTTLTPNHLLTNKTRSHKKSPLNSMSCLRTMCHTKESLIHIDIRNLMWQRPLATISTISTLSPKTTTHWKQRSAMMTPLKKMNLKSTRIKVNSPNRSDLLTTSLSKSSLPKTQIAPSPTMMRAIWQILISMKWCNARCKRSESLTESTQTQRLSNHWPRTSSSISMEMGWLSAKM
jgi:hypothetical protein